MSKEDSIKLIENLTIINMKEEIDCEYTKEIVCPHCGYEFQDSYEYGSDAEEIGLLQCDECGEMFYATRNITIDYSTEKATKGICRKCKKEKVVIESKKGSIVNYEDLCLECGKEEEKRQINEYCKELK